MKFRNTLLLLLVVIAVGVWALVIEPKRQTTEESEKSEKKVFAWKSADVSQIEIRRDSGTVVLTRDDKNPDSWHMTQPVEGKADRSEVDSLLSRLEFLEKKQTIAGEAGQKPDLKPYGLEKPRVEVAVTTKVGGKDSPTTLQVGGDAVGSTLYARIPSSGEVILVDKSLFAALDKKSDAFRDKTLSDVETFRATRLDLTYPDRTISLVKKDDAWSLTAPVVDLADKEKVDTLLGAAKSLKADTFVAEKPGDLATYGLASPRLKFTVSQGEEKSDSVLLGADIPDSGGLVYAKHAARDTIYGVKESALKELTADPTDIREKKVLEFESFDAKALTVKSGDVEITAERQDGTWKITKPMDAKAEETAVTQFLDKLHDLNVKRIAAEKADDPKTFGLDSPVTVSVTNGNGKVFTAFFGGKDSDGQYAYARREAFDPILAVDVSILDAIPKSALALRDREVLDLAKFRVQKLAIDRAGVATRLEKRDGDKWLVTAPVKRDADKDAVDAVLNAVAPLKAKDLVAEKADDPKAYGLDAPEFKLTLTTEKDTSTAGKKPEEGRPKPVSTDEKTETWTLLVGNGSGDAGANAMFEGDDLVFRIPTTLVDALKKDFLDRAVWDLDREQIAAIKIERAGLTLAAKKDKEGWSLTAPIAGKADPSAVEDVLRTASKLRAERYVIAPDAAATKLDAPEATVTLTLEKLAGSEDKVVKIGAVAGDPEGAHYASASGQELTLVLGPAIVKTLTRDLVSLKLFDFHGAEDVKSLEVAYTEAGEEGGSRAVTVAYQMGDDKKWKRTKPEGSESSDADPGKVPNFLAALTLLRGTKVASYQPDSPASHGLDAPTVTVALDLKDGKAALKVGKQTETADGSFAAVDGKPYVYVLSTSDVEKLKLKP